MLLFEKQKSNVEIIKTAITAICEEDEVKKTAKTPKAYQLDEISARILEKVGNSISEDEIKNRLYNGKFDIIRDFNIDIQGEM